MLLAFWADGCIYEILEILEGEESQLALLTSKERYESITGQVRRIVIIDRMEQIEGLKRYQIHGIAGYVTVDAVPLRRGKARVNNIEPGVIFQLLTSENGTRSPAGCPFMVVDGNVRYFEPDMSKAVTAHIRRKYPLRQYLYGYMATMTGAEIEVSNRKKEMHTYKGALNIPRGKRALFFRFQGEGTVDFHSFELMKD